MKSVDQIKQAWYIIKRRWWTAWNKTEKHKSFSKVFTRF